MAHSRVQVVQWLFLVSVALFIAGIAFIIAGARTGDRPVSTPDVPAPAPVATVKQIMNAIVTAECECDLQRGRLRDHRHEGRRDCAEERQGMAGGRRQRRRDRRIGQHAAGRRSADRQARMAVLHPALHRRRQSGAGGRRSEETRGVFAAGGDLNETCDACHDKYQRR